MSVEIKSGLGKEGISDFKTALIRDETTCNWVNLRVRFTCDTAVSVMGTDDREELLYTSDLEDHLFVVFANAYLIMQITSLPSAHKGDTNFPGCVLRI